MANSPKAPSAKLPKDGRYSYETPPCRGDNVLSPSGRLMRVLHVGAFGAYCEFLEGEHKGRKATFQSNDLRVSYPPKQV